MMKKIIVLFSVLLLLSGCTYVRIIKEDEIPEIINNVLNESLSLDDVRTNNVLDYFEYYLPSSMAENELDSNSVVLRYNNSRIIMNLNISNIINSEYYADKLMTDEGLFVEDYKIFEKTGNYDCYGVTKDYIYRLYKYEGNYVLHLETSDMNYYGQIELNDIRSLTRLIMIMARCTSIKKDEIISAYSNYDVIDYTKKQINLFDITMPSNGELSDLLIDGAVIGDGDITKDGQVDQSSTNNGAPIE